MEPCLTKAWSGPIQQFIQRFPNCAKVEVLLRIGVISDQRIQIRLDVLTILGFTFFFRSLPLKVSPATHYAGVEYGRNLSALLLPLVQYRFKLTDRDPTFPICQLGKIRMTTSSVPIGHTNRSMYSRRNCNRTFIRTIFSRYFSSPNPFQGLYDLGINGQFQLPTLMAQLLKGPLGMSHQKTSCLVWGFWGTGLFLKLPRAKPILRP